MVKILSKFDNRQFVLDHLCVIVLKIRIKFFIKILHNWLWYTLFITTTSQLSETFSIVDLQTFHTRWCSSQWATPASSDAHNLAQGTQSFSSPVGVNQCPLGWWEALPGYYISFKSSETFLKLWRWWRGDMEIYQITICRIYDSSTNLLPKIIIFVSNELFFTKNLLFVKWFTFPNSQFIKLPSATIFQTLWPCPKR